MDDDAPPGVPEWVVTYGDMMSLLLTFFIMLVSMSEVKADAKFRSVMEALAQYLGYPTAPASPNGEVFPLNSLIEKLDTLGSHLDDGNGSGGLKRDSLVGQDMRVLRNREGHLIPSGVVSFVAGTAKLTEQAETELRNIATSLAGKPHKIEIAGYSPVEPHSDLGIAASKVPSGRKIAYQRAKLVLEALERDGIRHERMRIMIDPVAAKNEQPIGEVRSADRVDIFVLDQFAEDLAGPRSDESTVGEEAGIR